MSIPVTDEMVEELLDNLEDIGLEVTMDECRSALTAALTVAGKDDLVGALGAIYEIREATGVGIKPMLSELADAIKAKQAEAIRAAVLKEREACAKQAERIRADYGNAAGEHIAELIRSRPDPDASA